MTNSLDDLDAVWDKFYNSPTGSRPGPDMISAKSGCLLSVFIVTQYNPVLCVCPPAQAKSQRSRYKLLLPLIKHSLLSLTLPPSILR